MSLASLPSTKQIQNSSISLLSSSLFLSIAFLLCPVLRKTLCPHLFHLLFICYRVHSPVFSLSLLPFTVEEKENRGDGDKHKDSKVSLCLTCYESLILRYFFFDAHLFLNEQACSSMLFLFIFSSLFSFPLLFLEPSIFTTEDMLLHVSTLWESCPSFASWEGGNQQGALSCWLQLN